MPEQRWLGEWAQGDPLGHCTLTLCGSHKADPHVLLHGKLACEVRIFVGCTAPAVECAETILDRPVCDVSDVMLSHSRIGLQHHTTSTVMICLLPALRWQAVSVLLRYVFTRRVQAKAMRNLKKRPAVFDLQRLRSPCGRWWALRRRKPAGFLIVRFFEEQKAFLFSKITMLYLKTQSEIPRIALKIIRKSVFLCWCVNPVLIENNY